MKSLDDLFTHFPQDIYCAERQILKALPKMTKNAGDPDLKHAFTAHREETVHHVEPLEQVFEMLGKRPKAIPCEAIRSLLEEGDEVVEESAAGSVRDAGSPACGQAVEHYGMARYGALIAWAKAAGHTELVAPPRETLDEEKKADKLLNDLAIKRVNRNAATKKTLA